MKIWLCVETFGVRIADHSIVHVIAPHVELSFQKLKLGVNKIGKASLMRQQYRLMRHHYHQELLELR